MYKSLVKLILYDLTLEEIFSLAKLVASGYLTSSLLIFYEASRWTEIGGFLKAAVV